MGTLLSAMMVGAFACSTGAGDSASGISARTSGDTDTLIAVPADPNDPSNPWWITEDLSNDGYEVQSYVFDGNQSLVFSVGTTGQVVSYQFPDDLSYFSADYVIFVAPQDAMDISTAIAGYLVNSQTGESQFFGDPAMADPDFFTAVALINDYAGGDSSSGGGGGGGGGLVGQSKGGFGRDTQLGRGHVTTAGGKGGPKPPPKPVPPPKPPVKPVPPPVPTPPHVTPPAAAHPAAPPPAKPHPWIDANTLKGVIGVAVISAATGKVVELGQSVVDAIKNGTKHMCCKPDLTCDVCDGKGDNECGQISLPGPPAVTIEKVCKGDAGMTPATDAGMTPAPAPAPNPTPADAG